MINDPFEWYPGSFTKNFSWGVLANGLSRLHSAIRIAFDDELINVKRETCQQRLRQAGYVWHIPLNFFLLNKVIDGVNMVVVDELVYQAIAFDYTPDFDKIALIAFNNSYAGKWNGAYKWQQHPAPWAFHFVTDVVAEAGGWDTSNVSAKSIHSFIASSQKYRALDAGKISTNLNYMYLAGRLSEMAAPTISRWWVNSVFLILDRAIAESAEDGETISVQTMIQLIAMTGFHQISGQRSRNKDLALQPLISLYQACGGLERWSVDVVRARQHLMLPEVNWFANSDDPFYAIYPRDPNIIKSVPRACAMLAKDIAGFEEIDSDDLLNWNVLEYVKRKTKAALQTLRERGIKPIMSSNELTKLTRGE